MSKVYRHSDGSYRDYPESMITTILTPLKNGNKEQKPNETDLSKITLSPGEDYTIETKHVLDPKHLEENTSKKTGKKDAIGDLNKPRLSLIPQKALWALGGALTYGEKHYGTHNWRNGIKVSYLLDAALRHINEFNAGENIDQKSQNHHLGNAMANLAMAIELCESNPEMDDRFKHGKN